MSTGRPRRILVLEDDPEIRHLLSVILSGQGRDVVVARTAGEARAILARATPDLVVLDLVLPDADGRQWLTEVRERPEMSNVPVVVVSSGFGPDERRQCFLLGADAYLERPFDPEVLLAEVDVRLARAAARAMEALRDPLTGLLNPAGLREEYQGVRGPRALVLVELDGYGSVSEQWGWGTAERIVFEVARALASAVEPGVCAVRVGGAEFALLAPGADEAGGMALAAAAGGRIRGLSIEDPERETFRLTASMGVAATRENVTFEDAVELARRRLFRAREEGGNRVIGAGETVRGLKSRILVADDDDIAARILTHRLEREGFEVLLFADGAEAFEAILALSPDLAVLDVKMPGMDGFEILERLRRTPTCVDLPVVLLTSMGSEADVVRGFELGADDYVLKPFSPVEFVARVRRLLARVRVPVRV